MIKVFISHKREDADVAGQLLLHIRRRPHCDAYLDLFDRHLAESADDLGEYFRVKISECTHLMAVVSAVTVESGGCLSRSALPQKKGYPLSTFASGSVPLPDHLQKWPYLLSHGDVDTYLQVATAM